uniref:Putative secreted protein n=1 Tax=Amblyomma triste TaxID=251400 RepID=A0A023G0A1_AMBTT
MAKTIFCFLALTLFAVALGTDSKCQNQYREDDECDTDQQRLVTPIFHYDTSSQKCYAGPICDEKDRAKYFPSMEECKTKCNAREDSEEGALGLED